MEPCFVSRLRNVAEVGKLKYGIFSSFPIVRQGLDRLGSNLHPHSLMMRSRRLVQLAVPLLKHLSMLRSKKFPSRLHRHAEGTNLACKPLKQIHLQLISSQASHVGGAKVPDLG